MKYTRKKATVEAEQWTQTNEQEMINLCGERAIFTGTTLLGPSFLYVETIHGRQYVNAGDYVVKGPNNEIYVEAKQIFEKEYKPK